MRKVVTLPEQAASIKNRRFFLPPDALSTDEASIGAVISFIMFIYGS